LRLLAEGESIAELGVQRIATEAGVARSSLYVHFPDKPALLVRLAEDLQQKSYELVSAGQRDSAADTLESLLTLHRGVVSLYRDNRGGSHHHAPDASGGIRGPCPRHWRRCTNAQANLSSGSQRIDERAGAGRDPAPARRSAPSGISPIEF
jgi:AcrR family transcriptional regulator